MFNKTGEWLSYLWALGGPLPNHIFLGTLMTALSCSVAFLSAYRCRRIKYSGTQVYRNKIINKIMYIFLLFHFCKCIGVLSFDWYNISSKCRNRVQAKRWFDEHFSDKLKLDFIPGAVLFFDACNISQKSICRLRLLFKQNWCGVATLVFLQLEDLVLGYGDRALFIQAIIIKCEC